jgi:hypothetical protein
MAKSDPVNIKDLASELENLINKKMVEFSDLGKKVKEASKLIEDNQLQMYKIIKELEPIEYIVRHHNPDLCELFDALKEIFEK